MATNKEGKEVPPFEELLRRDRRFWEQCIVLDECWHSLLYQMPNGYHQVRRMGKAILCHRYAYLSAFGTLDPDLNVNHSCDNRDCINPAHLWQGTQAENLADMWEKGRGFVPKAPNNRGDKQGRATVTDDQASEIYRLMDSGMNQREVGELFGIDRRTVGRIWRKETWNHLHEESLDDYGPPDCPANGRTLFRT